jgi:hypothetical protein
MHVSSQHVTQGTRIQNNHRKRMRTHSDAETWESLHVRWTLTKFRLNEQVNGSATFCRTFQYLNSLACTHQFSGPFFWDIEPPHWMICVRPLGTTGLARCSGHQSPSDARQYRRRTEKSTAPLRQPKNVQGSLVFTAYSRTDGQTDGRSVDIHRLSA